MDNCDPEARGKGIMKMHVLPGIAFRLGAPILTALLMNGCLSSADRDPPSQAADDPSGSLEPAQGAAVLQSMGYPKDQIKQVEGGFIVQGDMFFRLSDLAHAQNDPLAKTAQRQSAPISDGKHDRRALYRGYQGAGNHVPAVWRTGSASWSALLSGDNFVSQRNIAFGFIGAVPVIGTDIDQDGLRDLAIWNPANGTWTVKTSASNFASSLSFVWGQ